MTAIERAVSYAQFPKEGDTSCCGGDRGEPRGGPGGGGGSVAANLSVVSVEGAGQAGASRRGGGRGSWFE